MIDPSEPRTIRFDKRDVPNLPEVPPFDFDADQRRRNAAARMMERLLGFLPFGSEW